MSSEPDLSPAAVAARIRQEIQRRAAPLDRFLAESAGVEDSEPLTAALEAAAANALVGQGEPPLLRWRGIPRYAARWTTHAVRLLSGFITVPQSHFNLAVLKALRNIAEQLSRTGARLRVLEGELARAETTRRGEDRDWGNERPHGLDALYAALYSELRGSRAAIKTRLRVYLPFLKDAQAGTPAAPVLDVGCGRGEWLELLREEGLVGRGVDRDRVAVEDCRARGLAADVADALTALRGVPDASVGAVTALHVIEQMPFGAFVALVDECVRVLQPTGVAIFETPHPAHVLTSTYAFLLDSQHRHPLPSPVVQFVAQARGLTRVEVLPLHPPASAAVVDAIPETLRTAPQTAPDYAVVAHRA